MSEEAKFIPLSNRFLTQLSESRREKNGIAVPFRATSNMAANTRGEHHNHNILWMQLAAGILHIDNDKTALKMINTASHLMFCNYCSHQEIENADQANVTMLSAT